MQLILAPYQIYETKIANTPVLQLQPSPKLSMVTYEKAPVNTGEHAKWPQNCYVFLFSSTNTRVTNSVLIGGEKLIKL